MNAEKIRENPLLVKFTVGLVIIFFIGLSGQLLFLIVGQISSLFDLIIQFIPVLKGIGISFYLAVIAPAWLLGYLYAYCCAKIIGNNLKDYSKDRFVIEIIFFIWIIISMMSGFGVRFL